MKRGNHDHEHTHEHQAEGAATEGAAAPAAAVAPVRDNTKVTNGVADLGCRPTAGQNWRQTTSVGTAGRPPVIASRKRPRVAPQ